MALIAFISKLSVAQYHNKHKRRIEFKLPVIKTYIHVHYFETLFQ